MVVTDIEMPGLDGLSVALRVGESYPGTPVLLITGCIAASRRAANLPPPLNNVMAKPFALNELSAMVLRMLNAADRHDTTI